MTTAPGSFQQQQSADKSSTRPADDAFYEDNLQAQAWTRRGRNVVNDTSGLASTRGDTDIATSWQPTNNKLPSQAMTTTQSDHVGGVGGDNKGKGLAATSTSTHPSLSWDDWLNPSTTAALVSSLSSSSLSSQLSSSTSALAPLESCVPAKLRRSQAFVLHREDEFRNHHPHDRPLNEENNNNNGTLLKSGLVTTHVQQPRLASSQYNGGMEDAQKPNYPFALPKPIPATSYHNNDDLHSVNSLMLEIRAAYVEHEGSIGERLQEVVQVLEQIQMLQDATCFKSSEKAAISHSMTNKLQALMRVLYQLMSRVIHGRQQLAQQWSLSDEAYSIVTQNQSYLVQLAERLAQVKLAQAPFALSTSHTPIVCHQEQPKEGPLPGQGGRVASVVGRPWSSSSQPDVTTRSFNRAPSTVKYNVM